MAWEPVLAVEGRWLPRPTLRAARGLLFLAAVLLLALPGAHGDRPVDPRAVVWSAEPLLHGTVVAACGETSPVRNGCSKPIPGDACDLGCSPDVATGLGFTGLVTAIVWGKGSRGDDRHVSWQCPSTAGSRTNLPVGFRTGDCWGSSNAEACPWGEADCYLMWAPFRLEGRAGSWQGLGPAGSWTARVVGG